MCYMGRATVELQIPAEIYERARQIASDSNRSLESILLDGLALLFGDLPDTSLSPLVNLWATLRWQLFRRVGRGPRTVMVHAFRLKRFVAMLRRVIERLYHAVMVVPTSDPT